MGAAALALAEYEPVCRSLADRYWAPGMDRDDLMQEARLGVMKGLRDWRGGRGRTLGSFVWMCAERNVVTAVKAATRGKHRLLNEAVTVAVNDDGEQVDALALVAAPPRWEPHAAVCAREELADLTRLVRERLTPLESACVVGRLGDDSREQLAGRLGVTTKAVDNALTRASAKLARPESATAA